MVSGLLAGRMVECGEERLGKSVGEVKSSRRVSGKRRGSSLELVGCCVIGLLWRKMCQCCSAVS